MVAAWGSGTEESNDEEIDGTIFMAVGDSDLEDDENSEVSILDLNKNCIYFQKIN